MSDDERACSDRYTNKMISNQNVPKFHTQTQQYKVLETYNKRLLTGTANAPQAKTTTMALVK